MNTVADPIRIVICGGYGVGKTSLLRRFVGQPVSRQYESTSGATEVKLAVPFGATSIQLTIVDLAAEFARLPSTASPISDLLKGAQAACIVVDCGNKQSLRDADQWMEILEQYPEIAFKYLIANKADLQRSSRILVGGQLDKYACQVGLVDWAFTVSHPELGDLDCSRACSTKQLSIHEIIALLVQYVLHSRHKSYFTQLHLPVTPQLSSTGPYSFHSLSRRNSREP